jgi:hypothetical protein
VTPTMADPGLELPLPAEPVALRERTRALVEHAPADGAALIGAGEWIAETLWSDWGPLLEPAGMDRPTLVRVAADYRLELWLWVMGERPWSHCVSGLRGRVLRRLDG